MRETEPLWRLFDQAGIDVQTMMPYPRQEPTPEPAAPATIKPGTPQHAEIVAMEARLQRRLVQQRLWGTGITVRHAEAKE
jgi:hypothetical protein